MRLFIGIIIPEELRENIRKMQKIFSEVVQAKFVEEENLHLCFSFLGEKNENEVEKIKEKMDFIAKNFKSFEMILKGVKLIPSKNFVRVIALDAFDENRISESLRIEIVNEIGGDSKPLHLTLCRVKKIYDRKKFFEIVEKNKDFYAGKFLLSEIQLIKSKLRKEGPVYEIIHKAKLL